MRTLGRAGIWIAFLLLVLAGTSWGGLLMVAPEYFLIPAAVIFALIVIANVLPGPRKQHHAATRSR
jgi:hypothetical protein